MTAKEILENYLKCHGFDGLCYPPTECGCGLDDLIGPCDGAQANCKPAFRIEHHEHGRWYVATKTRPTEDQIDFFFTEKGEG